MEAPAGNRIESESGNESHDEKKGGDGHSGGSQVVPPYLSALMRRQFLQEMVKNLPKAVQDRVVACKNLQLDYLKLESEFFEEVYQLEKKYHAKYQPLFEQRQDIIVGKVDTPNEKPKYKDEEEDLGERTYDYTKTLAQYKNMSADTKGIPNFWLIIFRNTELLTEMVQDHDEPALKKLNDIKIKYNEDHSYTLEFHFDKNEYFSDAVLTKQYFLKAGLDEDYPFGFEGPEIYKCKGCEIHWEKKMNLTVKTIRKKQKHKERGAVRTIVKQVPNDSFFNFFNPPDVADDKEDVDEETQGILATDFEIGHFLRSRVIPKAILYFTGEVVDDEDDDEFDQEGEDESDESGDENAGDSPSKKKNVPNECPNQ